MITRSMVLACQLSSEVTNNNSTIVQYLLYLCVQQRLEKNKKMERKETMVTTHESKLTRRAQAVCGLTIA